jgi:hypothetical protein
MSPPCPNCGKPLPDVLPFDSNGKPGMWYFGDCPCFRRLRVDMTPGTSLKFSHTEKFKSNEVIARDATYEYVEVSDDIAKRSRYTGEMMWIDEEVGAVAIFLDPVTHTFYGQG